MRHPRGPLFVIADGGRARFVERSPETGDFRTLEEFDGHAELERSRAQRRRTPAVRSIQSMSVASHTTGKDDPSRQAKAAFVETIMTRAVVAARQRPEPGMVLVAPARLLGEMASHEAASSLIRGQLPRDLTKTPDHDLHRWLGRLAWP